MLLTLTTTHTPATDLGYLLHKNPARPQAFPLAFGQAHVFYPEVSETRCTAALLLDVDPVGLIRRPQGGGGEGFALEQYVNDRPYVASSFLSVALAQVFGTALGGRSKDRPDLAAMALPLEATVAVVTCRGGADLLRRLFEPLGYTLTLTQHALDPQFPEWGSSPYFTLGLQATTRLRDLLSHLYVLLPVLDDAKHYWVGEAEVEKLLRHGAGWLAAHPERALIARRYLKHQPSLTGAALVRLVAEESPELVVEESPEVEPETVPPVTGDAEAAERVSLHEQRLGAVVEVLKAAGAHRVLDLGCGEGRLLKRLLADPTFTAITGMDVAHRALEIAAERLHLDRLSERQRARIQLLHGSLIYRDTRLAGYDAAAVVEVIEHLDPPRLAAFERGVFEFARPGLVVLTTPNAEYNTMWPSLPAGQFRHRDHRFEWTRAEFQGWAAQVAGRFGYTVRFVPVGPEDPAVGAPSQMGVFTRPD